MVDWCVLVKESHLNLVQQKRSKFRRLLHHAVGVYVEQLARVFALGASKVEYWRHMSTSVLVSTKHQCSTDMRIPDGDNERRGRVSFQS